MKPLMTGRALISDIDSYDPPHGSVAFWWLGQNGFALKGAGCVLYIDAYLASDPGRRTPPLVQPHEVTHADAFLGTHDHSDHVDRVALPGLLQASPQAKLVVSKVTAANLVRDGYDAGRVIGITEGDWVQVGPARIGAIRAAHEFLDLSAELGYPHLGFVIELNGATIYHAGDGVPWEGLRAAVAAYRPDAVFVPINGRDAERYRAGCIGNFTFQEAVDLVGEVRPRLAVPMHYDMFAGNSEQVERFTDYLDAKYPGIPWWTGSPGSRGLVRSS